MKERPILFSGPMVRAILEGRKTQTRRILKHPKHNPKSLNFAGLCPYGPPGDRLWVRETFCIEDGAGEYPLSDSSYPKDGRPVQQEDDEGAWAVPWYRATDGEPHITTEDQPSDDDRTRWKPSIFMPRWASRTLLEVTEVRVQRLQDVSEEDAAQEGVERYKDGSWHIYTSTKSFGTDSAKRSLETLWDSINGKRPGCDWQSNPWVWAVSFKGVK